MTQEVGARPPRIAGVDVARGVASLLMIQGHAYHGWVASEHHDAAYAFTRVLGTIPLPAFLVLAGASVGLRLEAAERRAEKDREVGWALSRRGLRVLFYGYLVSLVYALIDGAEGLPTYLRADVLHVIGLSIALSGGFVAMAKSREGARAAVAALTLVSTAACPWVSRFAATVPDPIAPVVGLFADRPPYGRMPLIPLFAWFGMGLLMVRALRRRATEAKSAEPSEAIAGAPKKWLVGLLLIGIALAIGGEWATAEVVAWTGEPLTRRSIAVWVNVIDLGGRGLATLAFGALLSLALPSRARAWMVRIGRGSLVAYVVHIPFCYGVLGGDLVRGLDMATATLWLVPLMVGSLGVVFARDALRARWRTTRSARSRN